MPGNHMSKTLDSDGLNGTETAILELVTSEETLSNAEIAEKVGTQVSTVRDIRREYTSDDPPSDSQAETVGDENSSAVATDATQELIQLQDSDGGEASLLDSLHDGVVKVVYTGDEPVVCSVNQAFEATFGYSAAEIVGESLREYLVPEEYAQVTQPDERSTAEMQAERAVTRRTQTGVREFLLREIPHEENGEQYVFKLYTEITSQKRREVELQREVQWLETRTQQLEHERQELEQFASVLSHDLRNPISIAEGYLGQIKTEDNEDSIAVIERALSRMNALIDDTLTLKQQSEQLDAVAHHSIDGLAEAAWELVETGDSELRVVDRFDIVCDADRISRLLENLFRNAIDHNEGPCVIRIGVHDTLTTSTRGRTETGFFLADDGCGIPEDKHDQVFEIGETTTREGTGLGLPIIKRIADAHDWNVQIVESFDGGAKFVFTNVDIG